jgi:Protein of unknown function (DUF3467)
VCFQWNGETQALLSTLSADREADANHQGVDSFCHLRLVGAFFAAAGRSFLGPKSFTLSRMSNPTQPNVKLLNGPDYRENYANSVQMRVNIWDFFLVFGTLQQQTETHVEIKNFEGIYLSPQQAKALLGLLQQNIAGYESAFGEIKLDPRMGPQGPVH